MLSLDLAYQKIDQQLSRWDGRLRHRDALLWVPRGLLAGLMVGVALAAVARFRPLLTGSEILMATAIFSVLGMVAAALWVYVRRRSVAQKARFADRQFGLKERLITAVELREAHISAPETLRDQQVSEAAEILDHVDTPQALPLEINTQDWSLIVLALALLAAAMILPNPQESALRQARAVEQAIVEQVEQIEAIQEEIQQNDNLTATQQDELLRPLNEALAELESGDLTQEEALAALSEAQSELRALQGENDQSSLQDALSEAGGPLSGSSTTQEMAEAMAEQNLGETGRQLRELASQLPSLTEEAQQDIGRRLSEAAQQLQATNPELAEQLATAGTSLQQGDVESAQEALESAAEQLEQAATQQALSEAAGQTAEQLQEGRSEVAQAGQEQSSQQGQQGQEGQTAITEGQQGQTGQSGEGQSGQQGQSGQDPGQGQLGQEGQPGENGSFGGTNEGGGSAAQVFVPPFRDLSEFEGVEVELPAECVASPEDCGQLLTQSPTDITSEDSLVPYEQVYSEYANTAYEALEEDYVPLGMKSYIRDYFTSLEPGE
ncbi:MAG: hypothetical protein QNJ45_08245 [Ardenticatenaceae bacterium]|nr:hypothetical protein [Ardenticatenaceae bacterium]